MTIILFILAIGAAFLIISLVIMWYVVVIGLSLLAIIATMVFYLTASLAESIIHDQQTANMVAALVVILVLAGFVYLSMASDKVKIKRNGR